tara:strand:- start:9646 stop:10047 length:402 start_codon:yes stop_codon:yes gene_type:complete
MILLNRSSTNKSVFTLFEKTTLSPVYYLFEFIDGDTNTSKLFTGVDISTNKERYNEFVIELTEGVEDLLNSVINLQVNGYYTYKVYEQSSATNLLVANAGAIVELGKVKVDGIKLPIIKEYTEQPNTKTVYNG